jgi:hypothetical protein
VAGALLMAREDEVEVFRVVDGIEDGENGTAGVANYMLLVTIPLPQDFCSPYYSPSQQGEKTFGENMGCNGPEHWMTHRYASPQNGASFHGKSLRR